MTNITTTQKTALDVATQSFQKFPYWALTHTDAFYLDRKVVQSNAKFYDSINISSEPKSMSSFPSKPIDISPYEFVGVPGYGQIKVMKRVEFHSPVPKAQFTYVAKATYENGTWQSMPMRVNRTDYSDPKLGGSFLSGENILVPIDYLSLVKNGLVFHGGEKILMLTPISDSKVDWNQPQSLDSNNSVSSDMGLNGDSNRSVRNLRVNSNQTWHIPSNDWKAGLNGIYYQKNGTIYFNGNSIYTQIKKEAPILWDTHPQLDGIIVQEGNTLTRVTSNQRQSFFTNPKLSIPTSNPKIGYETATMKDMKARWQATPAGVFVLQSGTVSHVGFDQTATLRYVTDLSDEMPSLHYSREAGLLINQGQKIFLNNTKIYNTNDYGYIADTPYIATCEAGFIHKFTSGSLESVERKMQIIRESRGVSTSFYSTASALQYEQYNFGSCKSFGNYPQIIVLDRYDNSGYSILYTGDSHLFKPFAKGILVHNARQGNIQYVGDNI